MLRISRTVFGACVLAVVAACSSTATPPPGPAQPVEADPAPTSEPSAGAEPSTADGIFTVAQAARGKALFDETCSECHEVVDWTDAGFKGRWEDESVFQLWYYINDRMPYDDPWSLSRQQVTDVLTYILELNDLPAGDTELGVDDDTIDDFWIAWDAN
jgi:mono/diheme cytochrome c family protein